jgi:hypothetical protein
MGEVEIVDGAIFIRSHIVTYGMDADEEVTERIRAEIETLWNEPAAFIWLRREHYRVIFQITSELKKNIDELEVLQNTDPRNNYFRIEGFVHGDISFVDGIGCNTGYFKLENLYEGSTTAAHEYGHTIGLAHPSLLDIRGQGIPGIMYPRGTWVDPQFQYDPARPPGAGGGTMHPAHRRVLPADIDDLHLERLRFQNNKAILGEFTNIYHWSHQHGPLKK